MRISGPYARMVAATTAFVGLLVTAGVADQKASNKSGSRPPDNGGVSSGDTPEIQELPNFALSSEPTCAVHAAEQLNIPNSCETALAISSEGNVGIGTIEPQAKFDVYSPNHPDAFRATVGGGFAGLFIESRIAFKA